MKNSKLFVDLIAQFKLSLLDKYILNQITLFFLFSVGLFSTLGVAVGTLSDLAHQITEYNLPIKTAIKIFLLHIPEFVAYALPISVLLSTLLTYGRLSADSELVALRSFGVSIYRLVIPILVFSTVITAMTFFFNEFVVPTANWQATILQDKYIQAKSSSWQQQDIIYPEYELIHRGKQKQVRQLKKLFYAEGFDGNFFYNLTILNWSANNLTQIITCETAKWNNRKNIWDFFQGKIEYLSERKTQYFTHQQFPFTQSLVILTSQARDPFEMNIIQAQNYLDIFQASGDRQKSLLFQVRIQQKIAFPFICMVFAIIGSAIGISSQVLNRSRGFGLCVVIVFSYYLLAFLIGSLGLVGIISPWLAAWLPNLFGFSVGGCLLMKADL